MPVLDFLRDHSDEAYTFGELAQELHNTDVTLDDLDFALSVLASNGVIETSTIQDKVYYMYRVHRG